MRELLTQHKDSLGPNEEPPYGYSVFGTKEIFVRRVSKDFPIAMQWHTFWHEYFHMLLDAANRDRMARDEVLVDNLGGLHMQAMMTLNY